MTVPTAIGRGLEELINPQPDQPAPNPGLTRHRRLSSRCLSSYPVEVLIRAIENSAPNEDTTRIVYGGTVYHVSVDVAPLRRVDLALRFIAEGVRDASFSNPKAIEENLAEHLTLAAANDMNAPSVKKKNELERIAMASR